VQSAVLVLRCALQAGLVPEVVVEIAGGQGRRLLAGEPLLDLGPAPGVIAERHVVDPLLDRIAVNVTTAIARLIPGADGTEGIELARLACAVGEGSPHAHLCGQVLELLDRFDAFAARAEDETLRFSELGILTTALVLARTPGVGLPDLPDEPSTDRETIRA
jgi:hypothetical protein